MSSIYGENLKLSIFGQSHGAAIGMTLDGIPAGLPVSESTLQFFMDRRAPGNNQWSTTRKEPDKPVFLSGIADGYTCGAPITAVIYNQNAQTQAYRQLQDCPRPGHADYTADVKYGGYQDAAGGGHFSGRLTAPLCIAGGLCLQWLNSMGIRIGAHIRQIGPHQDTAFDPLSPQLHQIGTGFPTLSESAGLSMQKRIAEVKADGDSIGGAIECAVTGLPAGIGEPIFGGVESRIAQIIYGIPGVKALSFGLGEACKTAYGSQCNDPFYWNDGKVMLSSNNCGGILGGITTGTPVIFSVTVNPTPSIAKKQNTVNLATGEAATVSVTGRHDPCIVPRAVPVVEAAAAIAVYDMILGNTQTNRRK